MPRYKPYDYDQLMMIPVSLEQQLAPGTLEYAIHRLIEERIDTSVFDEKYRNDGTGRRAYDPKVLLKVVLFAYSRSILHSRKIERACRENVTFMALACGQKPDHSTVAAFISDMGEERVVNLFTQVLLVCEEDGLLGGTQFSLDGLKLPSNASKEWSGTHAELQRKKEKLEAKVKEAVREHREKDRRGGDPDRDREQNRINRLQRNADRIEKFLSEAQPKRGVRNKEVQSNVTDNDSAKMVSSHGVIQGYNANALVDGKHQVVVHAQAFGEGEDAKVAAPMLEGAERNLKAAGLGDEPLKDVELSADTGYFSVDNLEACRDAQVDAYIPDREFRKRDPRFANAGRHRRSVDKHKQRYKSKKRWFGPEDFRFDDRTKRLTCPAGHGLYVRNRNFSTGDGYKAIAYQAPKRACRGCTLRAQCLRHPERTESRQVHIFYGKRPGSLTDAMKAKIDTPEGRRIYSRRLSTVEPVFANVRAQKRMDRFTLRGRLKVNIQWMLYCMVHNMEKIVNFGESYAMAGA
ncbi:MAG: IS1182 family transposase [Lentisphaerae bacterium]|nr:IS1182 family transposase [Lentisphaerota bacterium]